MTASGAEETALAETVMDVLSKAGTRWSAMALPGVDLTALKRAHFLAAMSRRPARGRRSGSAPPAAAPASCQDWQGAFVVAHLGRAGLIVQGDH
jgi:hypothetical protein